MSKTLVVLEGNCGDEGMKYKKWLEENLPENIELDFRAGCSGVGGGMVDEDQRFDGEANEWWGLYCDS